MPRNAGSEIDTAAGRMRDRDGQWHQLDRLTVGGHGLYWARPTPGNALFSYCERWLLPDLGWAISRFAFHPHLPKQIDWYMETDLIQTAGPIWRQRDGYLDVGVYEGVRYELEDADELAEAIAAGEIPLAEALAALHALDQLCVALQRNGFSGRALLAEFAPDLPH